MWAPSGRNPSQGPSFYPHGAPRKKRFERENSPSPQKGSHKKGEFKAQGQRGKRIGKIRELTLKTL